MMVRIVSIPKEVIMKEVWSKSWKKVLIWACGFVSLIAFAVAGGYAIVKGEDEGIKRAAKQCFVVTLIFLAANALISILSSIAGLAASAGLAEVLQWLNFILLIAKIGIYAAAIVMTLVSGKNETSAPQTNTEVKAEKTETGAQDERAE